MTKNQTPTQYLESHDLTREFQRLGVTDEQLQSMRFRGSNKGWPFAQWSYTWLGTMPPPEAIPLVKAYCALKWLALENPADSRDIEDAWHLVSETIAAPIFKIGLKTKEAQSKRARKPRGKVTDNGLTIGQVIGALAVMPQYRGLIAKELWDTLLGRLDGEGLDPREIVDQQNPAEWTCEYNFKDGRKKITRRRFENIVSKARSEK
jgi:hypothetical protein